MIRFSVFLFVGCFLLFAKSVYASPFQDNRPNEICHSLDKFLFKVRPYRFMYGEYSCSTAYWDLPGDGLQLDNFALYARGSKMQVEKVYIVANIYYENDVERARNQMLIFSNELYHFIFQDKLPLELQSAVLSGEAFSDRRGGLSLSMKTDKWPTGLGYEVHFIVENAK